MDQSANANHGYQMSMSNSDDIRELKRRMKKLEKALEMICRISMRHLPPDDVDEVIKVINKIGA